MAAINGAPSNPDEIALPDQAKGNPVYEQTRQDMPMWCCGRNCGRNARITVFILGMVGIVCSSIVCLSPQYFSFVSLRNDTFYDIGGDKGQPKPFEYATEANVGLFRYEIVEVYEYPWPSKGQRELFDAIHERELDRLAAADKADDKTKTSNSNSKDGQSSGTISTSSSSSYKTLISNRLRVLQNKFPDQFYDDDDDDDDYVNGEGDDISNSSQNATHQTDTMDIILTKSPSETPPPGIEDIPVDQIPEVIPGSNEILLRLPTSTPTSSPTAGDPNDKTADIEIGVVKAYPAGVEFDSVFTNGQMGAMWAPIFATIGLVFSLIEFCCCIYKCSWLPTALFLYAAFMLQLMTMFLFMSEDFCKYDQDCALGFSGFLSAVAVIAYMICQTLVCMTPRPPPIYNLCKKPPVRKKKKKKKHNEFDETEEEQDNLANNDENDYYDDDDDDDYDGFSDEHPNNNGYDGYVDPYDDDQDPYDDNNDGYDNNNYGYNDDYDEDEDDYNDYEETVGTNSRRRKK